MSRRRVFRPGRGLPASLASGSMSGLRSFSSRLPGCLERAPWAAACAALAPAHDLTSTLPHEIGLIPAPVQAWLTGPSAAVGRPHGLGDAAARTYLADAFGQMGSIARADRLMLTASTSEAYALLIKLLCSPGEAVAVAEPGYPLVPHIAALEGVRTVVYRLVERSPEGAAGWRCDLSSLRAALAAGAKLVAWVAPHNPTGHLSDPQEAQAVADLCRQFGAALVIDEVFRPFVSCDWAALEAAWASAGRVFYMGGLSKWAGMAHLKLGWVRLGGSTYGAADVMARLSWLGDTFLSVNQPVQAALPDLWRAGLSWRQALQRRLVHHRGQLAAHLSSRLAGCPGLSERAVGGWMSILRGPLPAAAAAAAAEEEGWGADPDAAWAIHLAGRGVRVHPGFLYDLAEPQAPNDGRPSGCFVTSQVVAPAVFTAAWRAVFAGASVASCGPADIGST